jgi:TolB-like protein/DNA-binding winged helix-turn-helix (wHTH) protein/Tfp pilus assembly protein PilF
VAKPVFEFGDFRLDVEGGTLLRGGTLVSLTPKAFETLVALVECRDHVAEKAELLDRLWPDQAVEEGNLTQQIFTLRKALGDSPGGNVFIRTIPRRGYRFVAEVRVLTPEGAAPVAGGRIKAPSSRRAARFFILGLAAASVLAAAAYLTRTRARPPASGRLMLAVLPFENLSEGAAEEYFADSLTEELITVLARLDPQRLGVIARTSVMAYKTRPKPIRDVARELRVDYVIEGSVRHANGRLRLTAQLIDARSEAHLWADVYEQEVSEVFRAEAQMAENIGKRLSLRLLPRPPSALSPPSPEAHVAYLKGLHFWNKRDEPGVRRAIELFREAVDLDPAYARAHAGLAAAYASLATSADALAAREARALAEAGARRALSLDPQLAEGHAALAAVACRFDWNWSECDKELTRALELDPNYATGWHWRGEFLVERGRFADGIADLQRARTLDPLSPAIHANLGIAQMYAGHYDAALDSFTQALEIDPGFLLAHRVRGLTLLRAGRVEEGLASLRHARALDPRSAHAAADLGYALARAGKVEDARAVRRELDDINRERPVSPYDFAVVHAGLGENDAALGWLEKGYEDRSTGVRWLKVEPIFAALHSEKRFQDLVRRVGLPD